MEAKWSYRCEYIRCGKASCGTCPHGPYWYGYRHEKGRLHKKYFGKERPIDKKKEEKKSKSNPYDGIFHRNTASISLACEILGVAVNAGLSETKKAYREQCLSKHPDRGGSHIEFTYENAAWSYLRTYHGWK